MPLKRVQDIRQHLVKLFPANSLRKRFAVGMSWVMAGSLFRQVASFVTGILTARLLGMTDFGKLAVIQTTVVMISNFGQAGIGLSTTKYVASTRATDQQRAGRIIGFSLMFAGVSSLLVGVAIAYFSPWIGEKLVPGSNLSESLALSSAWIAFEIIGLLQLRILAGLESFRSSANITFYQGVVLLPLICMGAYYGGVTGTIVAYSIMGMLSCIVSQLIIGKECRRFNVRIEFRRCWEEWRILHMSTMVWLSAIAMNTTNWLVGMVLARQPAGLTEFALFNAASRFQNVLTFLPNRVFHVSLPVLANLQADGNRRGFTKALASLGALTLGVTGTGAAIFILFSERLMSWYGAGFAGGGKVLGIIALLCVMSSLWTVATAGLWAAEQSRQMLSLDVVRGLLLLFLCLGGLAATAQGLALAHLISYSVGLVLLIFALLRYLRQPWPSDKPVQNAEAQKVL